MQFLFTLFVSFAGIFASTLAVAGECDDRVLGYLPDQVVVYVIPSVSGTFRLPRLETDLIVGDGYAYRARRADNPPPSKPTDIFSEDPNITVNFVFKETDETYRKVYIRGPRNAVLSHLLQVTERESANIGVDFVSRLASQNPNILEQFLSQFPLAEAETEVAKAVELSAQISNRRLEIEKDRELAQLTDSSAVIVTVGWGPNPRLSTSWRNWVPIIPKPGPPKPPWQIFLDYLSQMGLPTVQVIAGQSIRFRVAGSRAGVIKNLYFALDFARLSGLVTDAKEKLAGHFRELDLANPPSERVRSLQERYLKKMASGLPADPVY